MAITLDGTLGVSLAAPLSAPLSVPLGAIQAGAVGPTNLTGAQSGSAPIYGCRAWCNFSGASGAINASGNVASVVRNSVGNYTVTFSTAMQDINYSAVVSRQASSYTNADTATVEAFTTTTVVVRTQSYSSGVGDASGPISLVIFR
jgi:hypothetical protein